MAIQWSKQSFVFFSWIYNFVCGLYGPLRDSRAVVTSLRQAYISYATLIESERDCVLHVFHPPERERPYHLNLFLLRNLWRAIWMMVLVLLGECRVFLRGSPFCPGGCRHFGFVVCRIAKHLLTMATLFIIQAVVAVRVSLRERKNKNEMK